MSTVLFRDDNYAPIQDLFGVVTSKAVTFLISTGPIALFTVTGDVIMRVFGICKTACASAGACNGSIGVSGNTQIFVPTTDMTTLAINEVWVDASPATTVEPDLSSANYINSNGQDVILTLSAQMDSGAITFFCQWRPLTAGSKVEVA